MGNVPNEKNGQKDGIPTATIESGKGNPKIDPGITNRVGTVSSTTRSDLRTLRGGNTMNIPALTIDELDRDRDELRESNGMTTHEAVFFDTAEGTTEGDEVFPKRDLDSKIRALVPSMLVNSSIEYGVPLDSLRVEMTPESFCVLCDVAGSTNMFNKLQGTKHFAQCMTIYRELHAKLTEIILRNGGDVLQYLGDEQVAVIPNRNTISAVCAEIDREISPVLEKLQGLMTILEHEVGAKKETGESVVGLRVMITSAKDLNAHIEPRIGVVLSGEALDRFKKVERATKGAEVRLHATQRKRPYFFLAREGANGMELFHPKYAQNAQSGNLPMRIKCRKADSHPDPENVMKNIVNALNPPSREEIDSLMYTQTTNGIAVYMDFSGVETVDNLNIVRKEALGIFEQYGGYVNKSTKGTGLLIIFGAGFDLETQDMMERAIRASHEVGSHITQMTSRHSGSQIKVAIGISHISPLTRATIGTEQRHETTIIGDGANMGARMRDAALKIENGDPVQIIVVAHKNDIGEFCDSEEGKIKVRGLDKQMDANRIIDIKPPLKTSFSNFDSKKRHVTNPEKLSRIREIIVSKAITTSNVHGLIQGPLLKEIAMAHGGALITIRPHAVDKFTEFETLFCLIGDLAHYINMEENAEVISLLNTIAEGDIQETERCLKGVLGSLASKCGAALYVHVIEAANMDQASRTAFEKVAKQINSIKFIFSGEEYDNPDIDSSYNQVDDDEGALLIANLLHGQSSGSEMEDMTKKRLIKALSRDSQINVGYIGPFIQSLIHNGILYQDGTVWKLRQTTEGELKFDSATIFTNLITPLAKRFSEKDGAKAKRFQNFALCFSIGEPLNKEHIPENRLYGDQEWEEFTTLLASAGILKRAPIPEAGKFTPYANGAFYLEPRLVQSAKECLIVSDGEKAAVHKKILGQNDTIENFAYAKEDIDIARKNKNAQRAHFISHADVYFDYVELTDENTELFYKYLLVLEQQLGEYAGRNQVKFIAESLERLKKYGESITTLDKSKSLSQGISRLHLELLSAYVNCAHSIRHETGDWFLEGMESGEANFTTLYEKLTLGCETEEETRYFNTIVGSIILSCLDIYVGNLTISVEMHPTFAKAQKFISESDVPTKLQIANELASRIERKYLTDTENAHDLKTKFRRLNALRKIANIYFSTAKIVNYISDNDTMDSVGSKKELVEKGMKLCEMLISEIDTLQSAVNEGAVDANLKDNDRMSEIFETVKNNTLNLLKSKFPSVLLEIPLETIIGYEYGTKKPPGKEAIDMGFEMCKTNIDALVGQEISESVNGVTIKEAIETYGQDKSNMLIARIRRVLDDQVSILQNAKIKNETRSVMPRGIILSLSGLTQSLIKLGRQYLMQNERNLYKNALKFAIESTKSTIDINSYPGSVDGIPIFEFIGRYNLAELHVELFNVSTDEKEKGIIKQDFEAAIKSLRELKEVSGKTIGGFDLDEQVEKLYYMADLAHMRESVNA